jgi:hypothetical protein
MYGGPAAAAHHPSRAVEQGNHCRGRRTVRRGPAVQDAIGQGRPAGLLLPVRDWEGRGRRRASPAAAAQQIHGR